MKNNLWMIIVLVIIVGAGGFYAGRKYQQNKAPSMADFQARMGMRQGSSGAHRAAGSEMVRGEIISQDETSITIKLADESSKIVLVSENTPINKAEAVTDDLKTGEQVMIFGQANSDGSFSATNVQIGTGFGVRFGE